MKLGWLALVGAAAVKFKVLLGSQVGASIVLTVGFRMELTSPRPTGDANKNVDSRRFGRTPGVCHGALLTGGDFTCNQMGDKQCNQTYTSTGRRPGKEAKWTCR